MTYTSRKFGERVQKCWRVCSERLKRLLELEWTAIHLQAVPSRFPSWLHWLTPQKENGEQIAREEVSFVYRAVYRENVRQVLNLI